ncbi:MAG: hypothetical protein GY953_27080, partial [bacterium]|nr:hypothetical protein [bacterium]
ATALLGIVLSYPKPTLREMVDVTWTLFTNSTQNVPIQMSDPAGGVPGQVTIDDPTLTWNNYLVTWENPATAPVRIGAGVLAVPHLSLLLLFGAGAAGFLGLRGHAKPVLLAVAASACTAAFLLRATTIGIPLAASTALDPELAEPVLERIVGNIGVAMLETTDPDYRAALSPFVVDEKTDSVGDEIRRGLSVTLPSGALAQIDSVENISVQEMSSEDGGNQVLASWQSLVSGGHWGHQHRRVIEYRALLDITADQGDWKLSGLTILGARTPDPAAGPGVSL